MRHGISWRECLTLSTARCGTAKEAGGLHHERCAPTVKAAISNSNRTASKEHIMGMQGSLSPKMAQLVRAIERGEQLRTSEYDYEGRGSHLAEDDGGNFFEATEYRFDMIEVERG